MTTAIVTITCPSCGGKVTGIEALEREQTIACTYCGTELHVPRVGAEIVREKVVREVVVGPRPSEPDLTLGDSEPPSEEVSRMSLPGALAMAAVVACMVLGFRWCLRSEATHTTARFERDKAARAACEASCKKQCENGPRPRSTTETGDPDLDRQVEEATRNGDRVMCESNCEQKNDCYGLHAPAQ
jgi:hypothetical protein